MKYRFWFLSFLLLTANISPVFLSADTTTNHFAFQEIWAYVIQGEEQYLTKEKNITDIAYFSAQLNEIGRIDKAPNAEKIKMGLNPKTRVHCVISAPYNRSLMYWCLKQDLLTRKGLIDDIVQVSKNFDGIQIDFESIRKEEALAFADFLQEVKNSLPKNKVFSVALPARVSDLDDAYSYSKIARIADRVVLMAYDEHWRTGSPGEIASLKWCQKVLSYAKTAIPADKLIVGLPLYGRVWQKQQIAKALKYAQTLLLWKEHMPTLQRTADNTPFFEYKQTIDAVVYFEDLQSLELKLDYYQKEKVKAIGLWRISQEPASLWKKLKKT